MEEYQIEIIRKTSFHELTQAQREEMKDWFTTEEEFLDLQHLFVGIQSYKQASEKEQSTRKNELDELFVQVHSNKPSFDWKNFFFPAFRPFVLQPGFQLAFGLLFLIGIGYFLNSNFQTAAPTLQAKKQKVEKEKIETQKTVKKEANSNFEIKEELQKLSEEPISIASTNTLQIASVEEDRMQNGKEDLMWESYSTPAVAEETVSMDASTVFHTKDSEKQFNTYQPVSAQPEILELLFTTY
jgi:hypothetical protein